MRSIGRWGGLPILMLLVAGQASATENIICGAAEGKASMAFLVGTTPGLKPLSLTMDAGDKKWATAPEGAATPILIAQSFSDDEGMKIDVTDDNAERVIAKLRVSIAHDEGSEPVLAGMLMIVGSGAFAVTCEGE